MGVDLLGAAEVEPVDPDGEVSREPEVGRLVMGETVEQDGIGSARAWPVQIEVEPLASHLVRKQGVPPKSLLRERTYVRRVDPPRGEGRDYGTRWPSGSFGSSSRSAVTRARRKSPKSSRTGGHWSKDAHAGQPLRGLGRLLGQARGEVWMEIPPLRDRTPRPSHPEQVRRATEVDRKERVEDGGDHDGPRACGSVVFSRSRVFGLVPKADRRAARAPTASPN